MGREWQRLTANGKVAISLLLIMGTVVVIMAVAHGLPTFAGMMAFAFALAIVGTYSEDPGRRTRTSRR